MNELERLSRRLSLRYPDANVHLDEAESPQGSSWLDVSLDAGAWRLSIESSPKRGFGLSAGNAPGYGEGPDELYLDLETLEARVHELARSRAATVPPGSLFLSQLRERLNVSQESLAGRLGMHQATVSKMERRSDMLISTLRKVVAALGGRLEIHAVFPNAELRITQFDRPEEADAQPAPRKVG